jgi:hypothetical protein
MADSLGVVFEVTSQASPADLTIIKEEYNKDTKTNKIVFKTVLQTIDEVNQNKRYYSSKVGNQIVEELKPKATSRSLFQEIDHPFTAGSDQEVQKRRSANIELKNCGSLIREIYRDGNNIIGEVESLSGFRGPDLYNLIKHDKANIGFSVRMFGRLKKHPTIQEVTEVVLPIKTITYDVVSNPSHKTARIIDFIPESANEFQEELLLTESSSFILSNEGAYCPTSSRELVNQYLIDLISEKFLDIKTLKF